MGDPIHDRYRDLLGDQPDPAVVRLLDGLDSLLATPVPPAALSERLDRLISRATADTESHGHDISEARALPPTPIPLDTPNVVPRRSHRGWVRQLTGFAAAALVIAVVGLFVSSLLAGQTGGGPVESSAAPASRVPGQPTLHPPRTIWDLNPVARQAHEAGLGVELNLSTEIQGFTVNLRWAYADPQRIFVYYAVEGPPGRTFNTFTLRGPITDATGNSLQGHGGGGLRVHDGVEERLEWYDTPPAAESGGTITLRLRAPGLTAVEDLEAYEGTPPPYPNSFVATPDTTGQPAGRAIPLPVESDTRIGVYHYPGDSIQFVVVPGTIDIDFSVPVEVEALPEPETPTPPAMASRIAPDAALADEDAAAEGALDYARAWLGAVNPRVSATDVMILEFALPKQVQYAGSRMPVWSPASRGKTVWLVRVEADRFAPPGWATPCPACADATTALVTLDAHTGGVLWSAVGTTEHGEQVFPTGPRGENPDGTRERANEDQMVVAALDRLRAIGAITGDDPDVVLARPLAAGDISRLIGLGNYSPICWRPMYVVVLRGEFDAGPLMSNQPGMIIDGAAASGPEPRYVAVVFDQTPGIPGTIVGTLTSHDGAKFAGLLNGATDHTRVIGGSAYDEYQYAPCEDVVVLPSMAP